MIRFDHINNYGEGYVVHTVKPMFTAKWGFTTESEHSAFSNGMKVGEDRYISCMILSAEGTAKEVSDSAFAMPLVVAEYLTSLTECESSDE